MKARRVGWILALAIALVALGTGVASAALAGTWELFPAQSSVYTATVQPPLNADGSSSFKDNGHRVIPLKFGVVSAPGPVVFQSIGSDTDTSNDYATLTFTPAATLTFAQLTNLSAVYAFTTGNCHGGSLRWSVRISETASVFIYYGDYPNFTDCTTNNQSGVNMLSLTDARFDTSQFPGGTFYDTYTHTLALVGGLPIIDAALVLDSGWGGDQIVTLTSATVNDNTFTPMSGAPAQTCDLAPATIQITKVEGDNAGPVSNPESVQPNDDDTHFRVVDCKYLYNLATSSLSGAGRYKVEVIVDGNAIGEAAYFELR